MDTEKLKIFLQLAKTLSFNKASQLCHLSPSTLSRTIQQIERELGVNLFLRDNRTVALTAEGKHFVEYATDALQHWQAIQEELQEQSSLLQGALSIYCSVTASYSFLHDLLTHFRKQQPLIEITLHTGDPALSVERIIAGSEDIAIAAKQKSMPSSLSFKKIADSPLTLIRPKTPNNAVNNYLSVDELHLAPFILAEKGVTRERLDNWFRLRGITPNIFAQVAGHEAIVSMVSLGFGIGLVPKIVLDNSPLQSHVEVISSGSEFGDYEVGLCVLHKRIRSPIIGAFWHSIGAQ